MSGPITVAQWQQLVQTHGEDVAGQIAQEDGLFLADDNGQPLDADTAAAAQQGDGSGEEPAATQIGPQPLAVMPAKPDLAVAGPAATRGVESLAAKEFGPAPGQPSLAVPGTPGAATAGTPQTPQKPDLSAMLADSSKSISDLYDQAAAQLEARYKGPSTGDLLMQAGAALMQPTASGRFGDALANAAAVVPQWAKDRRDTANEILKARTALDLKKADALAGLQEKYITTAGRSGSNDFVYDSNLHTFVRKPGTGAAPDIVDGGTIDGHHYEDLTDGTTRVYNNPANPKAYRVYDKGGHLLGEGSV